MSYILAAIPFMAVASAQDASSPVSSEALEKKFLGVDKNGYPHVADSEKSAVAQLVISQDTPADFRSRAIWGLAISGYSPAAAEALAKLASKGKACQWERDMAAMGLRNFTMELTRKEKEKFRALLRSAVKEEGAKTPEEIIRALLAWKDGPWVAGCLGPGLAGSTVEIEVLKELPPGRAVPRLLQIYRTTDPTNTDESYNRRAEVGRALAALQDKRGIDILAALLDEKDVPEFDGKPNSQYRHNVFAFIKKSLGQDFGYSSLNYDPSIDAAIVLFRAWWFEHRYEFQFPTAAVLKS